MKELINTILEKYAEDDSHNNLKAPPVRDMISDEIIDEIHRKFIVETKPEYNELNLN